MKKRLISVALCAVFALGMAATVSSCGKDAEEDLNSFTMFVPCEVPDGYTSYNQLPVYKKLEEITGMKVNYVHGVYSDIQQMWTGDYAEYDVMMISDVQVGAGYPGGVEKGVSDGVLWDMSPYMDECIIGKKDIQSFEQFVQQMKTTYHVEDLVKVYQAAYLRYKAR